MSAYLIELAKQAAARHGLNPSLFLRQLGAESGQGLNPSAVSPAGAVGVGQLMPGTARMLGVKDPRDPAQNIEGSATYMSQLLKQFGDYPRALAAYNWGPGNMAQKGLAAAPRETQNYLAKILNTGNDKLPAWAQNSSPPQAQTLQTTPAVPDTPAPMTSTPEELAAGTASAAPPAPQPSNALADIIAGLPGQPTVISQAAQRKKQGQGVLT